MSTSNHLSNSGNNTKANFFFNCDFGDSNYRGFIKKRDYGIQCNVE